MSYILDALRRADTERDRGAIPNLHTKPVPAALADADDDDDEVRGRSQPLWWAVVVLALVLAAVLAWLFFGGNAPDAAPAPATQTIAPAPTAVVQPTLAPRDAPATPEAASPALPAPVRVAAPPVTSTALSKPVHQAAKPPAPVSEAVERPVSAFNDLPENIRRELPQLVIGGAMYSKTPASRMLILNGQVFHEGDKVAGELVLEQIKLKSAVLAYKGHRYGINY